ncbi:hypothetical protein [Achromobacter sp. ACRQX]|nr:hypothetical protein [Achromobacter sp. ACRQX]MCG7326843.1 hypothetical protein [Achromobacter sp. ACRQX]
MQLGKNAPIWDPNMRSSDAFTFNRGAPKAGIQQEELKAAQDSRKDGKKA